MEFQPQCRDSFMIEVGDFYMAFYQNYAQVFGALQARLERHIGGTTRDGALT